MRPLSAAAALAAAGAAGAARGLADADKVRTFGTGKSAFQLAAKEATIFEYTVKSAGGFGVMTHFWITGNGFHGKLNETDGTGSIDNATVRYYVDGETTAAIEFKPPLACGTGFGDTAGPWGTAEVGHGARWGAWYFNWKIPFQKSVRVTAEHPGASPVTAYIIVRGAENVPVNVGDVALPQAAKLTLHKIEDKLYQPLEWVPAADVAAGSGLVLLHTLAVESANKNFLEACYHFYDDHAAQFPGTVLSTGTEDYFDSAYYFNAGQFELPVSGYTHIGTSAGGNVTFSAYRFHEKDPLVFHNGGRFMWRVGDLVDAQLRPDSPKCFIDAPTAHSRPAGHPQPSRVTTYTWVYTW